ncbi:MAG: 30S ribosomal protein S3 [bacterium]|nr:30S ribosomal protein S3 [bacterium]
MGHKVDPRSFRLKQITTWKSKWFARKNFGKQLEQDTAIRDFLRAELRDAGLSNIEIERSANSVSITIHTSRPGVVIGRGGAGIEELKSKIKQRFLREVKDLNVNIQEVSKPYLDAELVVRMVGEQLEKRMPFRRAMKQTLLQVERAGALGVKISVAGRLNGAEIARTEKLSSGKIPLHTIRADIDYAQGEARTTYGTIGVKVWIYKGEVFEKEAAATANAEPKQS